MLGEVVCLSPAEEVDGENKVIFETVGISVLFFSWFLSLVFAELPQCVES